MKVTKLTLVLLLVITMVISVFAISSCSLIGGTQTPPNDGEEPGDENPGGEEPTEPVKLEAPEISLVGDTAVWQTVSGAVKYEIYINKVISVIDGSETEWKLENGQTFMVKAIGDGKSYSDSEWSNKVTYIKEIEKYTVTWKNGDTVLETDYDVEEGNLPKYDGAVPTRESDAQYHYVFTGWTPEITNVSGNVTYNATFTSIIRTYTVMWQVGNVPVEVDSDVPYGTMPEYNGNIPTKSSTAQYDYVFAGWSPEISTVVNHVTYEAQFTEQIRYYTVTFYSEDGKTVLDKVSVPYGSDAVYTKGEPTKDGTLGYTYTFDKWVTAVGGTVTDDLSNVVADRAVYATFKTNARPVTVYIVSSNSDYGTVSLSELAEVAYDSKITVDGDNIIIGGQTVTAMAKDSTAQYTYAFTGWATAETVGNDTIITANFTRTLNSYTITWKNGDTVLETDENVPYGTTPVYNGEVPYKAADHDNVYTFTGWSPAITSVSGDVTYYAQFTTSENVHTVIFYDDDGVTELGRVVVHYGDNAIYPNELPTKASTLDTNYTFEKWVTVKGGSTEASFDSITEDMAVYAKYTESARTYTVTFCDWDGTVLSEQQIEYGKSAEAPADPERDGFRFSEWDGEYGNITDTVTVVAKYVQQFVVEFIDYNNSIIDVQYVDVNGSAIAPEAPKRANYRFNGWSESFTNIVQDMVIKAEYIRQYMVIFVDHDGNVLKEECVDAGTGALAPEMVAPEGYEFIGWDKDFTNVSSDITVSACYVTKKYTVTFIMPDGTVIGESQTVEHGFSAIEPAKSEFYLDGVADATKVYGFTRWNKIFNSIVEDTVIEAIYESVYTKPLVVIEFDKENTKSAKLYLYNYEQVNLDAIEIVIDYTSNVGNIVVDSVDFNSASPLWVEDGNGNNNNQYVINNNEKLFVFAWANAEQKPVTFNWYSKVLMFNLSTDGTVVDQENFKVISCMAIVSDADGSNSVKVIPAIVYR